jgi:hypothetical protein
MAFPLIPLLTAGGLAGSLFGGMQRNSQYNRLMELLRPGNLLRQANTLYGGMFRSPMYGAAQENILGAGRAAEQSISRAGTGVTSGMNLLQQAAGAGVTGTGLSQLHSGMFKDALSMAQQNAMQQMGFGGQMMSRPSSFEQTFGSLLGASGPLLRQYLMMQAMKNGGGGGNAGYMGQPGWQYYVGGQG